MTALRPRVARRGTAAVVVLALVAACGGGDDDADRPVPTITSPTSTVTSTSDAPSSTLSPEEQDEADLRELAEAWFQVARDISGRVLEIDEASNYLAGSYLERFTDDQLRRRSEGKRGRQRDGTRHVLIAIELDGDSAAVEECVVDADVLVGEGGETLDDLVSSTWFTTTAERTDQGWRFSQRARHPAEGGDACPA